MGKSKYKYSSGNGKVTWKFEFSVDQLSLAKRAYGYKDLINGVANTESFEEFFIKDCFKQLSDRMEEQYKAENPANATSISDVEGEVDNSL